MTYVCLYVNLFDAIHAIVSKYFFFFSFSCIKTTRRRKQNTTQASKSWSCLLSSPYRFQATRSSLPSWTASESGRARCGNLQQLTKTRTEIKLLKKVQHRQTVALQHFQDSEGSLLEVGSFCPFGVSCAQISISATKTWPLMDCRPYIYFLIQI